MADVVMTDIAASMPVTRQAQDSEMAKAFREVAGRLVDMRGVAKPPTFTEEIEQDGLTATAGLLGPVSVRVSL